MEHYYSQQPSSKLEVKEVNIELFGRKLKFLTPSGVYSYGKIDNGSFLLVSKCQVNTSDKVLDMGCGYGLIGITLLKLGFEVTFTDINERAVKFCKKNLAANDVSSSGVFKGNLYEPINDKFDTILSNPPFHAGRQVCYEIIEKAPLYLNDSGSLQIVARHKRGGEMLEKKMKEVFGNVETLAKKGGFRIYKSVKD